MSDIQEYRIVETQFAGKKHYQVEHRTKSWFSRWFGTGQRKWSSFGETACAAATGQHGVEWCRAWIRDAEKAQREKGIRVIIPNEPKPKFQTSEHWENRPRWVDPA